MTNKEQLKQLARDIKFESVMFADEFKYSKKEDLRYFLWMCELFLWLKNNDCTGDVYNVVMDTELTEQHLIHIIKYNQDRNKLPKK